MHDAQFNAVRLVLIESNSELRRVLASHLFHLGFRDIAETDSLALVEERLATNSIDLLVATTGDCNDMAAAELVRKSRESNLGTNPFVVVIMVIAEANEHNVRATIDVGPDALLASPISVGNLSTRILSLVRERKPFVVTSNYLGPDRRTDRSRNDGEEIPLFNVPNPLRAKSTGEGMENLGKQIVRLERILNAQRIRCDSRQVHYVGSRLPSLRASADGYPDFLSDFSRMKGALVDLQRRIEGTPFAEIKPKALELSAMLVGLGEDPMKATETMLKNVAVQSDSLFQTTEKLCP